MRVFALADLHLSFGRDKPMDIFGELWRDHPARVARAWDAAVGPDDVVLVAGDTSWARTLDEAMPDLEFVAARPGRLKLLLKGNHDSWWSRSARVRERLPPTLGILHHDAHRIAEGAVVCGARGWNIPGTEWFEPERDEKIYRRELKRLALSLEAARGLARPEDTLLAMLHYPPLGPGSRSSEVLDALGREGVRLAVYGHLHGPEDHAWAPEGEFAGVELRFVAADFVAFAPQPVWDAEAGLLPPGPAAGRFDIPPPSS